MEPENQLSRRRKIAILIGLSSVSALLLIGLVDFALFGFRAYRLRYGKTTIAIAATEEKSEYLRGRFLPGQTNVFVNGSPVTINQNGFRGHELKSRSFRVACLGDSVTFGWSASGDATTYPAYLEQALTDLDVDVLNAGMPRWNTMNLLNLYLARIAPLKPDLVVLLPSWNDLGNEFAQPFVNVDGEKNLLFNTQRVIRAYAASHSATNSPTAGSPTVRWQRIDEFEAILRAFVTLVRAQGATPMLSTMPHFFAQPETGQRQRQLLRELLTWPQLDYGTWHRLILAVNQRIRLVAKETQTPLVDPENSIPEPCFTDICHLNDHGNQLLATALAPEIRKQLVHSQKKSAN